MDAALIELETGEAANVEAVPLPAPAQADNDNQLKTDQPRVKLLLVGDIRP